MAGDLMTTNVFSAVRCRCRACTVTVSESEVPVECQRQLSSDSIGEFCEVVCAEWAMVRLG